MYFFSHCRASRIFRTPWPQQGFGVYSTVPLQLSVPQAPQWTPFGFVGISEYLAYRHCLGCVVSMYVPHWRAWPGCYCHKRMQLGCVALHFFGAAQIEILQALFASPTFMAGLSGSIALLTVPEKWMELGLGSMQVLILMLAVCRCPTARRHTSQPSYENTSGSR